MTDNNISSNSSCMEKFILPIIVAVIAGVILLFLEHNTDIFSGRGSAPTDAIPTALPTQNTHIPTEIFTTPIASLISSTKTTSPQLTSSAPVIESIEFPQSIICDGRRYDALIYFHDLDGNTYRALYELVYSKKQTPFYPNNIEFSIDSQSQIQGAKFSDFVEWYIPGDEVIIKVKIEDRIGQSDSKDFEFKCSN